MGNAADVTVYRDGVLYPRWRAMVPDTIEIETEVVEQQFRVETRRRLALPGAETGAAAKAAANDAMNNPEASPGSISASERAYQPAMPTGCSCC